ncbi:RNA-binding protein [Strigomonas culicis]|uniref:RNA-binding protein n=1 Tax=Strigomonas culicis TaxID=28005 RepID=S9TZM3_9TRYP|nr:RNA-binding protein [Strigomonas culicis]|eukprot:EPY23982.1 RNA-binding protein [Strigomonas culicis]
MFKPDNNNKKKKHGGAAAAAISADGELPPDASGGADGMHTAARHKSAAAEKYDIVGSSAFVTYGSTAEADMAIRSLHNRYCMDARERPLQVSYCLKTDIISDFGYRHAQQLHAENPANPLPSILPTG